MPIVELDPELAWKAIEGYKNALQPEKEKLDAFYKQFICIKKECNGAVRKETVATHAFADPDILVPRSILRCQECKCLFDPHSGILLERGDDLAAPGIPIIRPK